MLGVERSRNAPHIVTEVDKETGAILARNPYNNEFAHRVAFADMSEVERTITCDRKGFSRPHGSRAAPAALGRLRLSGRVGAGLDPCAAMQTVIELATGEEREVVILLGEGENAEEARSIASKYKQVAVATEAIERVVSYWDELLNSVQVKTPDLAMDIMLNRGFSTNRSLAAFGPGRPALSVRGAYGFRDQLQDVCALATQA